MFYEGLEKSDLEAILTTLSKEMGEDFVQMVVAKNPPNAIKRQVDWLHSVCCQRHDDSLTRCDYYEEEMLDDGWTKYDHRHWLDFWKELSKDYSAESLQNMIWCVSSIMRSIAKMCEADPRFTGFLTSLVNKNPLLFVPAVATALQTAPVPAAPSEAADAGTTIALFPEE